jgi:hypothetical protein
MFSLRNYIIYEDIRQTSWETMSRNKVRSGLHLALLENKLSTSSQRSSLRLRRIICCQERGKNETEEQR